MNEVETLRLAARLMRGEPAPEPHPVRLPPKMPDAYAEHIAPLLDETADWWDRFDLHPTHDNPTLALARAITGKEADRG